MSAIRTSPSPALPLSEAAEPQLKANILGPFFGLTFLLTWGLAVLLMLFYDQIVAIFGEIGPSNPLFILAVYAPGISGVLLVLRHYGLKGLGSFFRRLTLWRASLGWWVFLVLVIPVFFYAGAAVKGTLNDPFPFSPWTQALPAIAMALFLGPIEEFGWRGLALPLMQRRFSPFWAGLLLGVVWALWHIPSFFISGTPQSAWDFAPFFIGVVTLSVILTPLFNAAKGSLLISALYHFQMMNPLWPDAQPYDTYFLVLGAIVIVWLNRRELFRRGAGVQTVLFPDTAS